MKSFRELRKVMAIGAVALLLLPCFCGCAIALDGTELPAPSTPNAVTPSNTQAAGAFAGAGNMGVKRLSGIKPVKRLIAAAPVKAQVINVINIQGTVAVVSGGTEMPAYADMRLSAGDKLTTDVNSRATLDLNNGGMVLVEASSALEITQSTAEYIEVSLLYGNIINNIEKGAGKYVVKANNVTMGVLGTVFRVKLDNGGVASVDLYEGRVSVTLVGEGGEEHSYDLGEGMSFEGTDETINNSIEKGALETGEPDLTKLPDNALSWIARSLKEREHTADESEMYNDFMNTLQQEIEKRQREDPPAAPPAPPAAPAQEPPAPAKPNLVWRGAYMQGSEAADTIVDYSLVMSWGVMSSTTPWGCGIHWSYGGWNPEGTSENPNSVYMYDGEQYSVFPYVGWGMGSLTVIASNLMGIFETGETTIDSAKLDVILVPKNFDKVDASQVFDHNSVVVYNKTPEIVASGDDGAVTVTVDSTTEEIEDYTTAPEEDSISIPVDEPSTVLPDVVPEDITGKLVSPNGEQCGVAIDSVAEGGDTITVGVYLPTEVLSEEDSDPDE